MRPGEAITLYVGRKKDVASIPEGKEHLMSRNAKVGLYSAVLVGLLALAVSACRGDGDYGEGGGGGATAAKACEHYCGCSFAAVVPSCQSSCVSGIVMTSDPGECAECMNDASCVELEDDACRDLCVADQTGF
jgi:hypothetical protein